MGELIHLPRLPAQQSNAYGFPPVEPIWTPPLVDVTGDALAGFSVWIGSVRVKSFATLSNAARFASELRVMLKGGEL